MAAISFSTAVGKALVEVLIIIIAFLGALPFCVPLILLISAVVLVVQLPYLGSLVVLPYIYGTNILTFFGILKRQTTWCVVYDSKTKLPIDPAYVTIRDMQGKEVSSIITDLSGRFALLLSRGLYTVEASKTNYTFPSLDMQGSRTDGKYNNLYFGSIIEIDDTERSVAISIPMDPISEDWNQVEKKRKDLFYRFDDKETYFHAAKAYTILALLLAAVRLFYYPSDVALHKLELIMAITLIVLVYTWRNRQFAHSFVTDKSTGAPVSFAKVSLYSARTKNKVAQKTASFEGQFTCLLSKGTYYVTIERRTDTGVYELVYTSQPFSVTSGYLGKQFKV